MEGVDYKNFDSVVSKLRTFFRDVKGFKEVHTHNKLRILAACEDQKTIATYNRLYLFLSRIYSYSYSVFIFLQNILYIQME